MKLYSLFALIATTAATKAQDSSQGAAQQSSQSGSDQSQGYQSAGSDQSQSYDGSQSYGGESYSVDAPVYAAPTAACCVSLCPKQAPFFNKATCACHAGIYEADDHYATESYRNSEQQYDSEEQSGYRKLGMSQPDGTIDTRGNEITRAGTIVLWVVFGLFFLLSGYYIRIANHYSSIARTEVDDHAFVLDKNHDDSILHFLASPALIAGIVTLIASLAYLTMATGNGWYIRCHDGRMFFFARYIDWVITTPLMLHALCHFAGAGSEIRNFLFFSDIVMIVAGLIASTITGAEKWVFFAFSMLAFLPVIYYICQLRDQVVDNLSYHNNTGAAVASTDPNAVHRPFVWFFGNYRILADITVVAWFLYPVVWILAEGTGKISVTGEAIFYAVLDFIAKGVFGWFIVNSSYFGKEEVSKYSNTLASKDWK
jgi:bacteriorhodopsin